MVRMCKIFCAFVQYASKNQTKEHKLLLIKITIKPSMNESINQRVNQADQFDLIMDTINTTTIPTDGPHTHKQTTTTKTNSKS